MKTFLLIKKGEPEVEYEGVAYITISPEAWYELQQYVNHCLTEVSGCGMVERIEHAYTDSVTKKVTKELEFRVTEVFLPAKQSNGYSATDISGEVIAELMFSLLGQGKNTENLRMHWHSHASMGVFHSGTDKDNYKDLNNGEFGVSLVLNRKGDVLGRIDLYSPYPLSISDVPIYVTSEVSDEASERIRVNIEAFDLYSKEHPYRYGKSEHEYDTEYGMSGFDKFDTKRKEIQKQIGFSYKGDGGNGKKHKKDKIVDARMESYYQHEYEVRDLLCTEYSITQDKAREFEQCDKGACHLCVDMTVCTQYMQSREELLYT